MYQNLELPTFFNSQPSSSSAQNAVQVTSANATTPPDCPNAGPYVGEGVEVGAANLASDPETIGIDEDDMDDEEDGDRTPDGVEEIRRDDRDEMPSTSSPEADPHSPNQMQI